MRTFIDLFCGIGGFRSALEKEGLQCVFSSEIDKHARDAYRANYGETPAGDITKIGLKHIPPHDILCAGFPCQSFSLSGCQQGLEDERGRLFYQIVRIAKYHKPQLLLLENVKNILTIDNGSVLREIKTRLERIGYKTYENLLNASDFGIPQKRERVYFVCIRDDAPLYYSQPKPSYKKRYLRDILLPDDVCEHLVIDREDIMLNIKNVEAMKPIRVGILNKGGQGERIYSVNGHAVTLSANGGGVGARTGLYLVNGKVRRLHIDEAKAAMGFNEKHIVSNGLQGYKQLGNAIIPPMVSAVYSSVFK